MKIWLTSDTHFGHANIIKYCNRPFQAADEMNHALVTAWNTCVGDEDVVFHMGDVAMGEVSSNMPFLSRLKGHKVLCAGNHDSKRYKNELTSLGWFVTHRLVVNDTLFQHFPLSEGCREYEMIVHGHAHGLIDHEKHRDVGVDAKYAIHFAPIPAELILSAATITTLKLVLHNGILGK